MRESWGGWEIEWAERVDMSEKEKSIDRRTIKSVCKIVSSYFICCCVETAAHFYARTSIAAMCECAIK